LCYGLIIFLRSGYVVTPVQIWYLSSVLLQTINKKCFLNNATLSWRKPFNLTIIAYLEFQNFEIRPVNNTLYSVHCTIFKQNGRRSVHAQECPNTCQQTWPRLLWVWRYCLMFYLALMNNSIYFLRLTRLQSIGVLFVNNLYLLS